MLVPWVTCHDDKIHHIELDFISLRRDVRMLTDRVHDFEWSMDADEMRFPHAYDHLGEAHS